jgi:hypothetical protein
MELVKSRWLEWAGHTDRMLGTELHTPLWLKTYCKAGTWGIQEGDWRIKLRLTLGNIL